MRRLALSRKLFGLTIVALLAASGCTAPVDEITAAEHQAQVEAWRTKRHADLMEPDGWLSLVGLIWLEDGEHSFGSDPDADIVYQGGDTPPRVGSFTVSEDAVRFTPEPGYAVTVIDGPDSRGDAEAGGASGSPEPRGTTDRAGTSGRPGAPDATADMGSVIMWSLGLDGVPVLAWGSLRWHIIRREGRLAIRLKDADSPVRTGFEGIDNFAVDGAWRLPGRFEAYDPPKTIMIPNILGTVGEGRSPGAAVFEVEGRTQRLDLWKDSDDPANFFTAFADETNGEETYGAGRFLWIDAPDEEGRIVVDFNKAYNPPCAFTPYATCPLPPEQNRLPLTIRAGGKAFESHDE